MIKIENTETFGWEPALRGMRNPMNSWDKADSKYCFLADENDCKHCRLKDTQDCSEGAFVIGKNDHDLAMRLRNAGKDHRKFLRMITVYADITAPQVWWHEFDTYKVGTVRNSCSKMHTIHVLPFDVSQFSHEGIDEVGGRVSSVFEEVIEACEHLRHMFNATHEKKYWRALIELLPESFNMRATVLLNYEVLANMYGARKNHKLLEWRQFCEWVESLPYSELITGKEKSE